MVQTALEEEAISIHAPSRERLKESLLRLWGFLFQSTLPRGSDVQLEQAYPDTTSISIHAPSRERPRLQGCGRTYQQFQSTLPRGSDGTEHV